MEKYLTIGIAGHVNHGKTSLLRSLVGAGTGRNQPEKQKLSAEASIARLELSSGIEIALIDVPGHARFLKNAIRGLSSIDMAILVIAADDGVMPQTLEHIAILKFFKIKNGFIVLNKTDLVDDETLEFAEFEIKEEVKGTFLQGKPIIPFSAIDCSRLETIREHIESEVENITGKSSENPFRLWIDQVRSFPGFGTVVCGTILSGSVTLDDTLYLFPTVNRKIKRTLQTKLEKKTRARSLEVHHLKVSRAFAGQRVGISLPKVVFKEVSVGMTLFEQEFVRPSYFLNVDLQVPDNSIMAISNRQRVKLFLGTSVRNALVVLMEKEKLEPGEKGLAQFRLIEPIGALPQDPFIVCPLNIQTVIGGGKVLEITRKKFRKANAMATLPLLFALKEGDLKKIIEYTFKANPDKLMTTEQLSQNSGFSITKVEAEIQSSIQKEELITFHKQGFYRKEKYLEQKTKLMETIKNIFIRDPLKNAASSKEIKDCFAPFMDEVLLKKMLSGLCNKKLLRKNEGGYQVPNLSTRITTKQENLAEVLLDHADKLGYRTFSVGGFCILNREKYKKNRVIKILHHLCEQEKITQLNDGHYISHQAMEQIKKDVEKTIVQKGSFNLDDSKEMLGYGRKRGIPVLEYLDEIGFTRRKGDGRVLMKD